MKEVALVLSSGGARGFAHIGAIEELEEQGYHITSVAGTSMGALIGGMYAAGELQKVKTWMYSLDKWQIISLVDFSLSLNHIVKGDKIMEALKQLVPDVNIEDLPIPFCAVATDLKHNREIVFDKGSLYEAIRASISIPSFFRPVKSDEGVFIDGGVVNPLPLNRVKRIPGDILVAVNVSAPDSLEWEEFRNHSLLRKKENNYPVIGKIIPHRLEVDSNYFSILSKTFSLMIQQNTILSIQLTPPDILVNIPMNRFGGFDYDKAEKITKTGRIKTLEAIDKYQTYFPETNE